MCEVSGCCSGCVPSASNRIGFCVSVMSGASGGRVVCGGVIGEKD